MVLNSSQKEELRRLGYLDRDIAEIGLALDAGEFSFTNEKTHTRISAETAKTKLGTTAFLSGIGRACFHATAMRGDESKGMIFIHRNY
ncbi:MAG: hypothetical protein IJS13_06940 [Paludibacteraceae bacterium]|nr:hypothetical protein [Paludibacteraceae bacterium]